MSQQERIEHREAIASDVEAVLDFYWKERPPPIIKAKTLVHWCDELQDWKLEQVVWALRKWVRDFPDKKPNPGHILGLLRDARGRKLTANKPPPAVEARVLPTADQARAILDEIGFKVNRMEGSNE